MSWQAILGVTEQAQETPIRSQNSHNRQFSPVKVDSANSANAFGQTENSLEPIAPLALPLETDFGERAAIIEYGAGVPREWAEGYARLLCLPPPPGIRPERWQQIIDDGGHFIDHWASQAASLGWDTLSVFGISARAPEQRLDMQGLVPMLCGRPVVMLTAEAATIDAGGEVRHRKFRRVEDGAVPVWEIGEATP
jgi:hypothetical protein